MKALFAACIFFCMITIVPAAELPAEVYDGIVLTEDATWKGTIIVRGFVVVAPQATLRIDPGTVVRFSSTAAQQLSGLVIQGRINAVGTEERPILLTSDLQKPARSSWGGVVLLSTEKRNLLEHSRIEYAETGIDVRFSMLTLKAVSIVQAGTALRSHDGVIQMIGSTVSDSETGVDINNSEFDSRDSTFSSCRHGGVLNKSSVVLVSPKIINNQQTGLEAEECRIKITDAELSGNELGVLIKGGEGQIFMSRFKHNRKTAMHLRGARIKIQRCLFADNIQDALRTEDGSALLMNNAFSSNGGYNLYNSGREVIAARQNWWGTTDPALIGQKIRDAFTDKNVGIVQVFPWLKEKPQFMP